MVSVRQNAYKPHEWSQKASSAVLLRYVRTESIGSFAAAMLLEGCKWSYICVGIKVEKTLKSFRSEIEVIGFQVNDK